MIRFSTYLRFERVDEGTSDELPLLFWVRDTLEAGVELLGCVHDPEVDAEVLLRSVSKIAAAS